MIILKIKCNTFNSLSKYDLLPSIPMIWWSITMRFVHKFKLIFAILNSLKNLSRIDCVTTGQTTIFPWDTFWAFASTKRQPIAKMLTKRISFALAIFLLWRLFHSFNHFLIVSIFFPQKMFFSIVYNHFGSVIWWIKSINWYAILY